MSSNLTSLSPNSPITSPAQPIAAVNANLSESDARTLQSALRVIEAARAQAKSEDQKVAKEASRILANILCYIAGFLDAKSAYVGPNAGFVSIFQPSLLAVTDPEKQLDDFLKSLKDALEPNRRGPLLGAALGLAAVACKVAADYLEEAGY